MRGETAGAAQRPIRLVLADDEVMLRRGLRVLLEQGGRIRVVAEAGNGEELLDRKSVV